MSQIFMQNKLNLRLFLQNKLNLVEQTTTSVVEQTYRTNSILSNRTNYVFPNFCRLDVTLARPMVKLFIIQHHVVYQVRIGCPTREQLNTFDERYMYFEIQNQSKKVHYALINRSTFCNRTLSLGASYYQNYGFMLSEWINRSKQCKSNILGGGVVKGGPKPPQFFQSI